MNCTACHTQMIRMVDLKQSHIWQETCSICNGVFFDAGEFSDFKEHTIFPEILAEETRIVFGFEITVVTTAKNKEDGLELLKLLKFPIKKEKVKQE